MSRPMRRRERPPRPLREGGQALSEYALILALVVLAAAVGLAALGIAVSGFYGEFASLLGELFS